MQRALAMGVLMLLAALAGCAAGGRAKQPEPSGLPAIASLDDIARAASEFTQFDVIAPLASKGTAVNGTSLVFAPGGNAWAVYRVDGTDLAPQGGYALGSDSLWLLLADYATGRWHVAGSLATGLLGYDFSAVGDPHSPANFFYLAVVADPSLGGQLDSLDLNSVSTTWTIDAIGENNKNYLYWNDFADSYRIYRSTLPGDPAPYFVGTAPGNVVGIGVTSFEDPITTDADGTWLPTVNDNGTPADTSDDFPSAAPGVTYYYRAVAVENGNDVATSLEVSVTAPWASRRSARRPLPDSTATTRVFADQLDVAGMTPEQIEFCATRFVGTQKVVKRRTDELREFNPEFLVLGYHLATGAGDIGNAAGNDWDNDADWPYVDRHENWFHHMPGSPEPNQRVDQLDYHWKVMDPSGWRHYLSGNLLEMLGEDHFDGWFLDSASEMWNTSPAQWWEGPDMFSFWTPQLNAMLSTVNARAQAHPLRPYIIPNAGAYITTASDITYYGCDGIMIEGYGHNAPGNYFAQADWELEMDRILDHQSRGVATILQGYINDEADGPFVPFGPPRPNLDDRMFLYGSYLLVRGPNTYINWLGSTSDTGVGQWYPEWDSSLGPPRDGLQPSQIADLAFTNGLYRRDFVGGYMVLVNPKDSASAIDFGFGNEVRMILAVSGGGNIDAQGNPTGTWAWYDVTAYGNFWPIPAHTAVIFRITTASGPPW